MLTTSTFMFTLFTLSECKEIAFMTSNRTTPFLFKLLVSLIFILGVVATVGHYLPPPDLALVIKNSIPPGPEWYGTQLPLYSQHSLVSFLHIIPAFGISILAPIQLSGKIRSRMPALHRWSGRLFLFLASIMIISGIIISFTFPFARSGEAIVSLVIASCFGFSLTYALLCIRKRDISKHRRWMIRALAAGFAPITMRIFFSGILITTDTSAREIFNMTLWIGLGINLLLAELWLNYKRTPAVTENPGSEAIS